MPEKSRDNAFFMKLSQLSDGELVSGLQDVVCDEQERLAVGLEYIAELDRRKLFYHCASLSSFLVEEFGLEESVAERRIRAARLLRRLLWMKEKIERGQLNLTLLELALGCAHREKLPDPELSEILEAICGMSCSAAKRELASRYPETVPVVRERIRRLTDDLSEVRFVASDELPGAAPS
jgi:hypothetical protein